MSFSLVIDDVSLVLLLSIVLTLSVSLYVSRAYQPLIHPLILSRQSDVSKVRQPNESAIYRNANAPAGFDLAEKPRKEALDVSTLIASGATGQEFQHSRQVYGQPASNAEIVSKAQRFASGLVTLSSAPTPQICAALCVETDSAASLIASIAGSHLSGASKFHTVVLSPLLLEEQSPSALPPAVISAGARAISAVVTSPAALKSALSLSALDRSALVILSTRQDAIEADKTAASLSGGSHRMRFVSFDEVLEAGSERNGEQTKADASDLSAIHSHYWIGKQGWTSVSHRSLIAGVTTYLSFYPADKIPSVSDRIFVEASPSSTSPTRSLMASATPSGLALSLLALYTGAAVAASTLTASYSDANPAASRALIDFGPTLIYGSAEGASSLACALTTVSRRSPLAALATKSKLYTLRNGAYGPVGLFDQLVFRRSREFVGCQSVRNLVILGSGSSVLQRLLDSLRIHLGCAVQNAFLPTRLAPGKGEDGSLSVTAPVSATHSVDLQAFADKDEEGFRLPAHVGPPAVSVEIKLVQSSRADALGLTIGGKKPNGFQDDPMGEVFIRGKLITGADGEQDWIPTGDLAGFRSNGTLVVFQDAADGQFVAVPTLSSREPLSRPRRSRIAFGGKAATAALSALTLLGVLGTHVQGTSAANSNDTLVNVARMGMLAGQRASWEQGVSQTALLELEFPHWSVFTSHQGGPPYKPSNARADTGNPPRSIMAMAYHSAARQDSLGRLAFRITGDESITTGSSLDGAACGEHVLMTAWMNNEVDRASGEVQQGLYANAARKTLDYILYEVPRTSDGAISHRAEEVALWSDGVFMGPPFIAYYGLLTRNDTLLEEAYNQIRLYRDGLVDTDGSGSKLWGHIRFGNGTWSDPGTWVTGNGWATAGMLRVLATIQQSDASESMASQKSDLIDWVVEVLNASYPLLDQDSQLFHNYMNETDSFLDSAGSALMAYTTFRLASLTGNPLHVDQAEKIYGRLQTALTSEGVFRDGFPTVDVLSFTGEGDTSSEALAFMLMMDSARRDYHSGGVVRITGTDYAVSAAVGFPRSMAYTLLASAAASLLAVYL